MLAQHLEQLLFLRADVIEQRSALGVGPFADIAQARGVVAALGEECHGCGQDGLAGARARPGGPLHA
jgi:hypothetical protein